MPLIPQRKEKTMKVEVHPVIKATFVYFRVVLQRCFVAYWFLGTAERVFLLYCPKKAQKMSFFLIFRFFDLLLILWI
jgi:hypothetical protein